MKNHFMLQLENKKETEKLMKLGEKWRHVWGRIIHKKLEEKENRRIGSTPEWNMDKLNRKRNKQTDRNLK